MVQRLALLPHCEEVLGSFTGSVCFCVVFECSPCVCMGSKICKLGLRLIEPFNLPVGCLSLCVSPKMMR